MLKKFTATLSGISAAALPVLALAQGQLPQTPITGIGGVQNFICTVIVGWMFTFLIVLTVVFVLVAAYKYLTAAGDPEKVKSASHMLIYAAVAIVVALFARGLPLIVGSLFSGGLGGVTC
ncbi:MAG: hypothetical protein Q8P49_01300 [Candidatus Liptonbacteria bacterium]|nr:hypothetical protein [Candidatus Liptonbacteria bacterium]